MKHLPFFPSSDGAIALWCKNYKEKIVVHATALGLDATQVNDEVDICNLLIKNIEEVEALKAELSGAVSTKELSVKVEAGDLKKFIANHKTSSGYTQAIGEDLSVIGSTIGFIPADYKAEISLALFGGTIRVKFKKLGADGINIYKRGKGENQWVFVSRATKSPFSYVPVLPVPGVPVHLEFRAFGVLKDVEIGMPSDINEILFGQ